MKKSLHDQIPAVTPAAPHSEQHAIEPDSEAELETLNLQLRAELQALEIDPQFAADLRAQLIAQSAESIPHPSTRWHWASAGERLPDLPAFSTERSRPRRSLFPWVIGRYGTLQAVGIIAIMVAATVFTVPLLTIGAILFYLAYRFFHRAVAGAGWDPRAARHLLHRVVSIGQRALGYIMQNPRKLGRMVHWVVRACDRVLATAGRNLPRSERFQILRCLVLLFGVIGFLAFLYTQPAYRNVAGVDTLWLLLALPIFILGERAGTNWVIAFTLLAGGSLLGLNFWLELQQNLPTVELGVRWLTRSLPEVLWLLYLTLLLYIPARYGVERSADDQLLQSLQEEILQLASGAFDDKALYRLVVERIATSFHYEHVHVFQMQPNGVLRCVEAYGAARSRILDFKLPPGRGIVGAAVHRRQPVSFNDVRRPGSPYYPHPALPHTRAEVAVPIVVRGQVLAVLDVQSDIPGVLLASDRRTLRALANHIGWVLDNLRVRRSSECIRQLIEAIAGHWTGTGDREPILTTVAQAACSELGADLVIVYERDRQTGTIQGPIFAGRAHWWQLLAEQQVPSGGLVDRLMQTLQAHTFQTARDLADCTADPFFDPTAPPTPEHPPFVQREHVQARAILWLQTEGDTLGLMFLNFRTPHPFDTEARETMALFANLASMILQKAQGPRPPAALESATQPPSQEYPITPSERLTSFLYAPMPVWFLTLSGELRAANGLALWLWSAAKDEDLLGVNVFDVFSRPANWQRIPFAENREFLVKKSAVAKRLAQYAGPQGVAAFVAAMHADAARTQLYEQAPLNMEREWEYWLHMGAPGERPATPLLTFSVIVNRVEADGEPGYLAIYRPTAETIPQVKQVYEQLVQTAGLEDYVRYPGGSRRTYPQYWPMIRHDRLWWIRSENPAHSLLWSQPSVGLHLLDFFFIPECRLQIENWEAAVLHSLHYFHTITAGVRRKDHPAYTAYQAVLSHLAQYADFPLLYQRTVADIRPLELPAHQAAEFYACDQSVRCRLLDRLWLHFRCMVYWERTPHMAGMEPDLYRETLVPADPVTHAALILLDLDRELPAAPDEERSPGPQMIWGLALVQTVLDGLNTAEADATWTPLAAFERIAAALYAQRLLAPLATLKQQLAVLLQQLPTRTDPDDADLPALMVKIAARKGYPALLPYLEATSSLI